MSFPNLPLPPAALLYPHACTIYREVRNKAVSGAKAASTVATIATGVACYLQTGTDVQSAAANGFIYAPQDNLDTYDRLHMAYGQDIRVGDVVKITAGPQTGEFYLVRGNDQARTQFAQKQISRVNRAVDPPPWVPQ